MGQINILKKLKKYARRESKKHFKAIEYEACLMLLIKPRPKYMPKFLWKFLINLLIKKDANQEEAQKGQSEQENNG